MEAGVCSLQTSRQRILCPGTPQGPARFHMGRFLGRKANGTDTGSTGRLQMGPNKTTYPGLGFDYPAVFANTQSTVKELEQTGCYWMQVHVPVNVQCVTFFWLVGDKVTGWCSRNPVLSLKLLSSIWVGALAPAELKDVVMCVPWGGTRTLPQDCTTVSWLLPPCFCIPSLPWLATIWTCP